MADLQPFDHYFTDLYDTKKRFVCYWNQIHSVIEAQPDEILEIGVGNKFVNDYLRKYGFNVISLDYNAQLAPNVVGSVEKLPFNDHSFHTVMCCEVLEHLPFELFESCLLEISRVAKRRVVISLPTIERFYRLDAILPKLPNFRRIWELPKKNKPVHEFDGEHYWELGKSGYGKSAILEKFESAGFSILREFRDYDDPIHRFFVLEVNGGDRS